ncbi:hypothetical protein ACFLZY_01355 [Patescibacteria group bacterium]
MFDVVKRIGGEPQRELECLLGQFAEIQKRFKTIQYQLGLFEPPIRTSKEVRGVDKLQLQLNLLRAKAQGHHPYQQERRYVLGLLGIEEWPTGNRVLGGFIGKASGQWRGEFVSRCLNRLETKGKREKMLRELAQIYSELGQTRVSVAQLKREAQQFKLK